VFLYGMRIFFFPKSLSLATKGLLAPFSFFFFFLLTSGWGRSPHFPCKKLVIARRFFLRGRGSLLRSYFFHLLPFGRGSLGFLRVRGVDSSFPQGFLALLRGAAAELLCLFFSLSKPGDEGNSPFFALYFDV